jgi:hypothetical protein
MYAPTDNVPPSRSVLMRLLLVRSWEYRHPKACAGVRFACAVFNLGLGVLMLSYGYWVGAVLLVGAALVFWTAYCLQTSVQS